MEWTQTMRRFRGWVMVALIFAGGALSACSPPSPTLETVEALHAEGKWDEALSILAEMLEANLQDPELNYLYGLTLIETGEPGLAIWPLQRAVDSASWAEPGGLLLARAFMTSGNYEDGLATVLEVLRLNPDNVAGLSLAVQARLSLNLEADALPDIERLIALEPNNSIPRSWYVTALIGLKRLDEAEEALVKLRGLSSERDADNDALAAWLCAVHAVFAWEKGDVVEASALFEGCLTASPTDYEVVSKALAFFDGEGDFERGTALLRVAHEGAPEMIVYRASLAERLQVLGRFEEGEVLLLEGASTYPSFSTWSSLANFYIAAESYAKASAAIEQAVAASSDPPPSLIFMQADLFVEQGKLQAAREVAEGLTSPLSDMLEGKILLEEGRPAEALEALEVGIQLWPNNALARYLAALAAEQLGDFDRAISEYRDSLRADAAYTDAGLRLSRLMRRLRNYRQALVAIRMHAEAHPRDVEALIEMVMVTRQTGPAELMTQSVSNLSQLPDQVGRALAESTHIIANASGPEAARKAIEEAGLDLDLAVNAEALEAWAQYAEATGDSAAVLARADRLLVDSPQSPLLHEIRARALTASGGTPKAVEAAYGRALEFGGERPTALAEFAQSVGARGETEAALALYDRAIRADPEDGKNAWAAIELLQTRAPERSAEIESRLEALLRNDPPHARASGTLARILLDRGEDLERVESLAKRSIRVRETPLALEALAAVFVQTGRAAAALPLLDRGLEAVPESGRLQFRRGLALVALDRPAEAREAFERALSAKNFDGAERVRQELARLPSSSQ